MSSHVSDQHILMISIQLNSFQEPPNKPLDLLTHLPQVICT